MSVDTLPVFEFHQGSEPLFLSIPHAGTWLPDSIKENLTDMAIKIPDTDWHLPRLYADAKQLGASILIANYSRYVIDLNRPPDNSSLYPGKSVTGLCPVDTFDNEPVYRIGKNPDADDVKLRVETIWRSYHAMLSKELLRMRSQYSRIVLWDAHSIRSILPRFFTGKLPDLNFGTANGSSCSPDLANRLLSQVRREGNYSSILNGRFKGGYITRQYGDPRQHIHAIQLEMAQCCYMCERWPFDYAESAANNIQPLLKRLLVIALEFAREQS